MSKPKPKEKKEDAVQSVVEVFSLNRDLQQLNPYHLDADIEMYTPQKLQLRSSLKADPDINQLLTQITQLYHWSESQGVGLIVQQASYKQIQRQLALILRPDIDKEQLQFVVDSDWELDRETDEGGKFFIGKQKLRGALWQLIDVWTVGAQKQEYLSFAKLLKKKLQRGLKIQK